MGEVSPQELSLIVMGGSAGGVEAAAEVVRHLPADIPAAVCIVIHFPVTSASRLPHILNKTGVLKAEHAASGQVIERGRIYVAPPDFHLLVGNGQLLLSRGPRYNGTRPAIDPLFRTAARAYGPRVIGVLLSGTLDDGVAGLELIRERGGLTMVQDPNDALFDTLPRSAMLAVAVDRVLPADQIGPELGRLVMHEQKA